MLYVLEILAKEPIALTPVDDTTWQVPYSFHLLGTLEEQTLTIKPATQWLQRD
jgi:hypothetical protein